MYRTAVTLVLLTCTPAAGAAQGIDKARLREIAYLPRIQLTNNFGVFYAVGRTVGFGIKPERSQLITEAEKLLAANPDDPSACLRLASLCDSDDDKDRVTQLQRKALARARERFRLHPKDGPSLCLYAQALLANDQRKEGANLLRRAVKLAPAHWEAWMELGGVLQREALEALLDPNEQPTEGVKSLEQMITLVQKQPPSPAELAKASKLLGEAEACFEKALQGQPREARAYVERVFARCGQAMCRNVLRGLRGEEQPNPLLAVLAPESVAELRRAAELSPRDLHAQLTAAFVEILRSLNLKTMTVNLETARDTLMLPADGVARVAVAIKRLEKLTRSDDASVVAGSSEGLGMLHMVVTGNWSKAATYFRRAVRLEPARESAWDFLTASLYGKRRDEELLAACTDRLKIQDTARTRFLLAHAYIALKQPEKAEEQIRVALKLEPVDFHVNLGQAALTLKRARSKRDLKLAARQLTLAKYALGETASAEQRVDWAVNQAVYLGLSGQVEAARELAREAMRCEPNNGAVKQLRTVLGD
jgi:tetratricopeptide (TPR) repeat protein